MNQPPVFQLNGSWTTQRSGLSWHAVSPAKYDSSGAPLGQLKDVSGAVYYLSGGATGTGFVNEWDLSATAPSGGCPEALMTSATATTLLSGTRETDGSVTYGGVTKKVALSWDNNLHVATLV